MVLSFELEVYGGKASESIRQDEDEVTKKGRKQDDGGFSVAVVFISRPRMQIPQLHHAWYPDMIIWWTHRHRDEGVRVHGQALSAFHGKTSSESCP